MIKNIIKKSFDNFNNSFSLAAGDPNAWRLGRIEEADHETAV